MTSGTSSVIVVGGGPAGLATAACLRERGVSATVLDRGEQIGQSWRDRYERLHLHTPRAQSHLPGFKIPKEYGRWVARADVVRYLEAYADHHGIRPELGVTVDRIDRTDGEWTVRTSNDDLSARSVVIATGYNGVPFTPDWPGKDGFEGDLTHAAEYRVPDPYLGKDVMVVGTGNTGAEIAADLAESAARTVWLSVRTPPHIIPRNLGPIAFTVVGMSMEVTPKPLADPTNALIERLTVGDLTQYGMPKPTSGILDQYVTNDAIPIFDVGTIAQLKAGRITPVAAVESFEGAQVVLADGQRLAPAAVIAATGYTTGLASMVGHLEVLNAKGLPEFHDARTHPMAPGLHFVGMQNRLIGLLNAIRIDARKTADAIVTELRP